MRKVCAFFDEDYSEYDLMKLNGEVVIFDENDVVFATAIASLKDHSVNPITHKPNIVYHRTIALRGYRNRILICSTYEKDIIFDKFDVCNEN